MEKTMDLTSFVVPGAGEDYRAAREKLLEAELGLREHVEQVAALRRSLPAGPEVPDYEFFDGAKRVRLSELFEGGKQYLLMYHVMYWQDDDEFCPMCSMWIDGIDGIAHHVWQRANIVAASLAPVEKLQAWGKHRKWQRIRVLADADPRLARDTSAEDTEGNPQSTMLVFEKTPNGIRHVYTAHAEYPNDTYRGVDLLCPTWGLLDLLPSGRGDFIAGNDYVT